MAEILELQPVLTFLGELSRNNNKPWFEAHRGDYEQARSAYEALIERLIDELRQSDRLENLKAKDCVRRIYRDIRFSKDKSPYKTYMGAHIAPGGRKSTRLGYHLMLSPGHTMLAGGLYAPSSAQLSRFRQAIDRDSRQYKALTGKPAFKRTFGEIEGEGLKTAPRGYAKDHPEIEILRRKQILVTQIFEDHEVTASDFVRRVVQSCGVMKPFLDYLTEVTRDA